MSGGLVQLVAYGAQDVYLTSNPQITFFKSVYRRHTNFAVESIEQTFNGNVDLGRRVTATISRNGDLIKDMWLEMEFSTLNGAVYGVGNAVVKQVEIEIGGQLIDRQYGEWLNIWSELTVPEDKRACYDEMVGNVPTETTTATQVPTGDAVSTDGHVLDVPLMFWFNRNPGLALPLIALQYHEVKLNLELDTAANIASATSTDPDAVLTSCKLWVDYVFLDTDERRRFAQVSHEYLIEQVQFTGDETITSGSGKRVDLNYNHPVKELIWVAQTDLQKRGGGSSSQPCQFTKMNFNNCKIQLNSNDRFTERRPEYFLNVQTFKHHTHCPRSNRDLCLTVTGDLLGTDTDGTDVLGVKQSNSQYIYVYSFALNPEELQPSGTCNFSRIDKAVLVLNGSSYTDATSGAESGILKVFAVNYNVLRIMSGMAGLAYSN